MTRLIVERFEEFLRFDEKRMTIKIGMFPAKEMAVMENNDTMIRSSSPLVKMQLTELQSNWGSLELLAVVLVILVSCFRGR